ncbi:MAG: hypothetical protein E7580_01080 [Ruminococcaceae bacterium]|nr:hypothetical protein [Oscillospiraceae bacterium]
MKRIISYALCFVLAVSMVLPLMPPADATTFGNTEKYEKLKKIDYTTYVYDSPEDKLATMTLVTENDNYSLFVQEYTAEVCVVDKSTNQMLFTNPYDVADSKGAPGTKNQLLSQILIEYTGPQGEKVTLNSYAAAAKSEQIQIKKIRGGVRVEYTIGEALKKRLVPYQIESSNFEENILKPLYESTGVAEKLPFADYLALVEEAKTDAEKKETLSAFSKENQQALFEFERFYSFYSRFDLKDPSKTMRELSTLQSQYPILNKMSIYLLSEKIKTNELTWLEDLIRANTDFTLDDLIAAHEEVEFVMENSSPPLFKMALEYTLEKDGFQVRLPARGISFDAATYKLETIQILPYLGAGRCSATRGIRQDTGYNFVPDGSGAIVAFDQEQGKEKGISGIVYGSDFGFYTADDRMASKANFQTWRAPVFGTVMTSEMVINKTVLNEEGNPVLDTAGNAVKEFVENRTVQQGYVAFITEGESLTEINSIQGNGDTHDYHAVSTKFFARQTDSYPLDGITVSGATAVYTKAIDRRYVGNYTIKYRMLSGEDATYVGMANAYREYLIKTGALEKIKKQNDGINLYLDLLGAIDTTETFLGVPVPAKAELTTFKNAKTILDELKKAGISNQVLRYLGWANGGMASTAPAKLDVVKELGGEKELKNLISHAQKQDAQIYLDLNFSYVKATAWFDGYDEERDAAKTIDGKAAYYQTYNPIVQAYNKQVALVLSAKTIDSYYKNITSKYKALFGKGDKTMSVGSLGYALNSSQDEEFPLNREDAKDYTASSMKKMDKDYKSVLIEKGNQYTWKYADTILDIPLDSSNNIVATAEIPFLGIVLHGYMNYTGEAINMAGDYEYNLLKTIENGANPYFVVAYDNISELKINGYSEYYAVSYKDCKDTIVKEYEKLNEILAPLQDQLITGHEVLAERVVKVSYENGTEIYLNYNNFAVTADTLEIPAMSYHVEKA